MADEKLISIIEEEQLRLKKLKKNRKRICGPNPTFRKIKTTKGIINCVATICLLDDELDNYYVPMDEFYLNGEEIFQVYSTPTTTIPVASDVNKNVRSKKSVIFFNGLPLMLYDNIHDFLIDLSSIWINQLKLETLTINCWDQIQVEPMQTTNQNYLKKLDEVIKEKNKEIIEIIYANFPKTFSCIEESGKYDIYVCGTNWYEKQTV